VDDVLGLARTGLIFTGIQEGNPGRDTAGRADPNLAKESRVFHTMCCHTGFRWGGAARRELTRGSGGHKSGSVRESGSALQALFCGFVFYIPLFCIIVVAVPLVCCSVKWPLSRPTSFCLFLSILLRTPAGRGVATWSFCCRLQPKPEQFVSKGFFFLSFF